MTLTAATTTPAATPAEWSWQIWLVLIGAVLLSVAGYAVACWLWPFTRCRRCDGTGRRMSPSGKNWGSCRRCKGKAARLRAGRKIFNYLKVTAEEAK